MKNLEKISTSSNPQLTHLSTEEMEQLAHETPEEHSDVIDQKTLFTPEQVIRYEENLRDFSEGIEVIEKLYTDEAPADLQHKAADNLADAAQKYLTHILPSEVSQQLAVNPSYIEINTGTVPPTLHDLYLLAEAYDATSNRQVAGAMEYIFDTTPPNLSEPLLQAYTISRLREMRNHDAPSVIDSYMTIMKKTKAA